MNLVQFSCVPNTHWLFSKCVLTVKLFARFVHISSRCACRCAGDEQSGSCLLRGTDEEVLGDVLPHWNRPSHDSGRKNAVHGWMVIVLPSLHALSSDVEIDIARFMALQTAWIGKGWYFRWKKHHQLLVRCNLRKDVFLQIVRSYHPLLRYRQVSIC